MREIKILGVAYKIVRKSNLMEDDGLEGYADLHNYEIVLDASLSGKALAKAFWHEVGHAYAYECGLHETLGTQAREMFAQTFAVFLCSLIKKPLKARTGKSS